MRQILTSRLSLSKHLAHNLGNLLLLGKIGVFHNRRNASSRLLLLISNQYILFIILVFRILACSRRLNASNLFLSLILHLGNLFLIVQLHFSKLFLILKSGVNHTSRGSISTSTLPSIKLRKCSSKIITSILSFISGRLATKSNQIKQLIRNGRSASLQRTFKKSFTSFSHSTRNKTRDGLIRVRNIRALNGRFNTSITHAYSIVIGSKHITLNATGGGFLTASKQFRHGATSKSRSNTHRHVYGEQWIKFMKDGVNATPLPTVNTTGYIDHAAFLGTINPDTNKIPKHSFQGYLNIYNNYFKAPWMPDRTEANPHELNQDDARYGFRCCHLKNIWTAPLPPETELSRQMTTSTTSIDIMGLQAAYANLHTDQERDYFMQRYHDVISSFGGKTSYDADNRPLLVMRSNLWASGYDVDGTDQTSLGQFSGRVQQTYKHSVPRFFVPEHGTMFTLALVRFPPTATKEIQYLNAKGALTYTDIAGDPVLYGNLPPREISMKDVFRSGDSSKKFKIAEGQWYRYAPSYVSPAYHLLEGFPFIQEPPSGDLQERVLIRHHDYDQCFQSVQLLQWNSQVKFNVTVYRNLPTTRDSIMTS